jgi:uncharacterized membrane protein YdjX (TVP38/TMEM64 family)
MAITHDYKGALLFSLAAIITQIAAAELAMIFLPKREQLSRMNRFIVIISATTTSLLAIRYLTADNEDALYFSGLAAQCAYIMISGVFMTLLSTVRLPVFQTQITQLQCKNNKVSFLYYIAAVGLGALLSTMLYIGLGFLLSGHWTTYSRWMNIIIGVLLLIVAIKRLLILKSAGRGNLQVEKV